MFACFSLLVDNQLWFLRSSTIRAMFINLQLLKAILMFVCAIALAFVAWRFILPLVWLHVGGVGVQLPLPKGFARAYPKLALYLFVLGGPLLFIALVIVFIWLLRLTPR
jgi:hypothetical protein